MGAMVWLEAPSGPLRPGGEATCRAGIRATAAAAETFYLYVLGAAAPYATVEPAVMTVTPGIDTTATITFSLPGVAPPPPGELAFILQVVPTGDAASATTASGTLTVVEGPPVAAAARRPRTADRPPRTIDRRPLLVLAGGAALVGVVVLLVVLLSHRGGSGGTASVTPRSAGTTPTATTSASSSPSATLAPAPALLFDRSGVGIMAAAPDGSDTHSLTIDGAVFPQLSPDATQVVYLVPGSPDAGKRQIALMDADGSGQHRVTDGKATYSSPSWSPDGALLAFRSDTGGQNGIYTMHPDGSDLALVLPVAADVSIATVRWSPRGDRIAFTSNKDNRSAPPTLFTMKTDGSDVRRVLEKGIFQNASWSPDGSRVVVNGDQNANSAVSDIYIIALDAEGNGTSVSKLTKDGNSRDPGWSRDGEHIAFSAKHGAHFQIDTMNLDGSERKQLTTGNADNDRPNW